MLRLKSFLVFGKFSFFLCRDDIHVCTFLLYLALPSPLRKLRAGVCTFVRVFHLRILSFLPRPFCVYHSENIKHEHVRRTVTDVKVRSRNDTVASLSFGVTRAVIRIRMKEVDGRMDGTIEGGLID